MWMRMGIEKKSKTFLTGIPLITRNIRGTILRNRGWRQEEDSVVHNIETIKKMIFEQKYSKIC